MQTPDSKLKFQELPLDLLAQVEQRFGIDRQAAIALLGGWLVGYKPLTSAPIRYLK